MCNLSIGDIIEIQEGHEIYSDIPMHFLYENQKGNFETEHHYFKVEVDTLYYAGKYIVTGVDTKERTYIDCIKAAEDEYFEDSEVELRINFYLGSSGRHGTIEKIEPIGKAKLTWAIDYNKG